MRRVRRAALAALGAAALLALAELALRGAGLGRPVLFVEDPDIEYRPAPDQDVRLLGRRQRYDGLGRRNDPPGDDPRRRVLVMGDSVLNGGNPTDQAELATSRLSAAPSDTLYLNASAGSWGPGNLRAWIDRFGLDEVEALVLVLSSHDWTDARAFAPLDPATQPVRRPRSAVLEALRRYVVPRLPASLARALAPARARHAGRDAFEAGPPESVEAQLRGIAARAAAENLRMCVVQHRERDELDDAPSPGGARIAALFAGLGVPVVDLRDALAAALGRGRDPYRDPIHINAAGQRLLATAVARCDAAASVPVGVRATGPPVRRHPRSTRRAGRCRRRPCCAHANPSRRRRRRSARRGRPNPSGRSSGF